MSEFKKAKTTTKVFETGDPFSTSYTPRNGQSKELFEIKTSEISMPDYKKNIYSGYYTTRNRQNNGINMNIVTKLKENYNSFKTNEDPDKVRIAKFSEFKHERKFFNGFDIAFVIDATLGMQPFIDGVKECIKKLAGISKEYLQKFKVEEDSIKFGIIAYKDHPAEENGFVTSQYDFDNPEGVEKFLKTIQASGGGDPPDAVLDGLYDALNKLSWREKSEKFVILVAESPPHGKIFLGENDNYSNGCPCGLIESKILNKYRENRIDFSIMKINNNLTKMIEIFSKYINIDVYQPKVFRVKKHLEKNISFFKLSVESAMTDLLGKKIIKILKQYEVNILMGGVRVKVEGANLDKSLSSDEDD